MYDYGYDYGYAAETATGMLGILGGLYFAIMIFSSIIGLIAIISYAKIFSKAGKPWWASIVPIYNIIVMLEIAKLPVWYIALFFVPIANIYAIFKINIEMAKKFGKGAGFGVGMTLLSIIFIPLLAFSDNKYQDDNFVSVSENNQFDANNVINNNVSVDNVDTNVVEPISNVTIENNPFAALVESAPVEPAPISVTPVESVIVEPEVNAFNMAPEANIEPLVPETISEPVMTEQLNVNSAVEELPGNLTEDKKVCKNCGNELPDIVSICPNCGTDNE